MTTRIPVIPGAGHGVCAAEATPKAARSSDSADASPKEPAAPIPLLGTCYKTSANIDSVEALYQCVAPTIAQGEQALSPRSAPGLLLHGIEAEGVLAVPWCQHIFYLFVRNNWLSHGKPKRVIALLVQHRP